MFLIQCEHDNSYCIINNNDVICDEVVHDGEVVSFFWNNKTYSGVIIMRSEDVDLLNKEIRRLKKIECEKKRLPVKNATVCSKRKSIKKKTWSPDQPSTARKQIKLDKQIKKGKTLRKNKHTKSISTDSSNTESLNTSVDDQDYDTNISTVFINTQETVKNSTDKSKINSSPTKEELKEIASKYYELLKKQQAIDVNVSYIDITKDSQLPETKENVEENENIIQNDDTNKENEETYSTNDSNLNDHIEVDQNEDNDDQLLGHDYAGDKMIYLQNGIYCKKRIYDYAVGSSHRASHMARKLLGVFKKDALLQCTFTGQTPRSLNKECKMQNVSCLHDIAKHAIIDFSREMAKKRGWERQSKEKVKQAMSQRLGELKRDRRNAVMQEREINA